MPLEAGAKPGSPGFSRNVATEVRAGKPVKQAAAIAYAKARGDAEKRPPPRSQLAQAKRQEVTRRGDAGHGPLGGPRQAVTSYDENLARMAGVVAARDGKSKAPPGSYTAKERKAWTEGYERVEAMLKGRQDADGEKHFTVIAQKGGRESTAHVMARDKDDAIRKAKTGSGIDREFTSSTGTTWHAVQRGDADEPTEAQRREAINKSIKASKPKIGGREGRMIHALLKGHDNYGTGRGDAITLASRADAIARRADAMQRDCDRADGDEDDAKSLIRSYGRGRALNNLKRTVDRLDARFPPLRQRADAVIAKVDSIIKPTIVYGVVSRVLNDGNVYWYVTLNGSVPSSPTRYKTEVGAKREAARRNEQQP